MYVCGNIDLCIVYMWICAFKCVCVWMYLPVCSNAYVGVYIYIMYKYVCSSKYMSGCIDLCVQVYMCVDVLTCALKCVCVSIYYV